MVYLLSILILNILIGLLSGHCSDFQAENMAFSKMVQCFLRLSMSQSAIKSSRLDHECRWFLKENSYHSVRYGARYELQVFRLIHFIKILGTIFTMQLNFAGNFAKFCWIVCTPLTHDSHVSVPLYWFILYSEMIFQGNGWTTNKNNSGITVEGQFQIVSIKVERIIVCMMTYIIGHYSPSVQGYWQRFLHHYYDVGINFIHKWRDLLYKIDTERQIFLKNFSWQFYLLLECLPEEITEKIYFLSFFISGLVFEPRITTRLRLDYKGTPFKTIIQVNFYNFLIKIS